jgi:hypothetical protein
VLALAIAVIGLITGNVYLLIIGGIVFLAAFIIQFLDYIMGAICVAGAFIINLVVGVINAMIQHIWAWFVYPFLGIIEWILNVCQGGFDSFGEAVGNLLGQIIGWFLELGKVVTTIIDAIFGTNWTAGLESLRQAVTSYGKNENAITITRTAPQLNRVGYGDAWNSGFAQGTSWKNSIGTFGSHIKDDFRLMGGGSSIDTDLGQIIDDPYTRALENDASFDPSKALKGINDTADNTGRMADSMDLTEEDLAYLRDVANMEWKREYTTANITLDVTNNNNVNSELDVFGIMTKFSDVLYEEMDYMANGVYSD